MKLLLKSHPVLVAIRAAADRWLGYAENPDDELGLGFRPEPEAARERRAVYSRGGRHLLGPLSKKAARALRNGRPAALRALRRAVYRYDTAQIDAVDAIDQLLAKGPGPGWLSL